MNENLISLIVPVFNCESKLSKCLESILNQTYQNIEVILIDDGSKDLSPKICDDFATQDKRIQVIHKKNEGVSIARNTGIKRAKGKFVQFVDSDDIIEPDMCEQLINAITKDSFDLAICGYKKLSKNYIKEVYYDNKTINKNNIEPEINNLLALGFINSPWNKLYVREKIKSLFSPNLSLGEDLLFNLDYLLRTKKIIVLNKCLYNYNEDTPSSLMKNNKKNDFDIFLKLYMKSIDFCKSKFGPNCKLDGANSIFIKSVFYKFQDIIYLNEKNPKSLIKNILINDLVQKAAQHNSLVSKQFKIISFLVRHKMIFATITFFKIKKVIYKVK